jgi:hypothetical protein
MSKRNPAFVTRELAGILPFEHRIVEHFRSAHEIDPVPCEVLRACAFIPFEHLDVPAPTVADGALLAQQDSAREALTPVTRGHA